MTIGPMGQEFWPEYNFGAFVQKLVHSIFRGLMEKSFVRKQILLNFVWKCSQVQLAKNFDRNTIMEFLHKKF